MKILVTTCSAAKRRNRRPLPACKRYRSPRMPAAIRLARRLGVPLRIFSGELGLLEPTEEIPWYDHALAPEEVAAWVPRVARELRDLEVTEVVFLCRPRATPGWEPYHAALEGACAAAGASLERLDFEELTTRERRLGDDSSGVRLPS